MTSHLRIGDSALAARLRREIEGDVLFDPFTRGRYSTDASHYQIEPIGVVVPRTEADITRVIGIAAQENLPILPRGAGSSQCGQTIGQAIIIDVSRYLNHVMDFSPEQKIVTVQPGVTLDQLNAFLKSNGLMFMVDVSTSSCATIGGMAGNNSCGARSIRYGTMRDNVHAIEALLADANTHHFGEIPLDIDQLQGHSTYRSLAKKLVLLGTQEANEIRSRFPTLMRRVGGYNIDALVRGFSNRPGGENINLAHLLVGSEGTLAFSTRLHLKLHRIPTHKVLGICHFPTFYQAMASTQHIVTLNPTAVELVDRTMIELAGGIPLFQPTIKRFVHGDPEALLLVEFAGDDQDELVHQLAHLQELMGELGLPGTVVEALDSEAQQAIWEVRKSGLNIMMSMKGDGKPISFIEDCAVPLEDLANYTDRLTRVFEKYGVKGTWYAHASVGCLHVRPVVNLKEPDGAHKMRAIAEEAFAMVREYKGSHSGEHGDGLVRSEFHEAMFGSRMVRNFENLKKLFDPQGLLNPGKIVHPPKMDDRSLFRFKPGYAVLPIQTGLDWSEWGGFGAAAEMCNNNGACRKSDANVMCPSFRVTGEEKDLTRGRANSLRLALSGQLGQEALTSREMYETMQLCVGCKGCRRECPTGVDMSRMKIEFLYQYYRKHRLTLREKLIAHLPRYASWASRFAPLLNSRDQSTFLAYLSESILGLSRQRPLPKWRRDYFNERTTNHPNDLSRSVVLLADTFNTYFEPENVHAAKRVLEASGFRVHLPQPVVEPGDKPRALCCGRTYLALGQVDEAKHEMRRTLGALQPFINAGIPVVGLEPSCLLTLRDEFLSVLPPKETKGLAESSFLLEEFLMREHDAGKLNLSLNSLPQKQVLLHGHCHQKAFGAMGVVQRTLGLIPSLEIRTVESSCCGMAGAFGYQAESYSISMRMAELALLPAVRKADEETLIVADGTSCRHQIAAGAQRQALHVARVLEKALA